MSFVTYYAEWASADGLRAAIVVNPAPANEVVQRRVPVGASHRLSLYHCRMGDPSGTSSVSRWVADNPAAVVAGAAGGGYLVSQLILRCFVGGLGVAVRDLDLTLQDRLLLAALWGMPVVLVLVSVHVFSAALWRGSGTAPRALLAVGYFSLWLLAFPMTRTWLLLIQLAVGAAGSAIASWKVFATVQRERRELIGPPAPFTGRRAERVIVGAAGLVVLVVGFGCSVAYEAGRDVGAGGAANLPLILDLAAQSKQVLVTVGPDDEPFCAVMIADRVFVDHYARATVVLAERPYRVETSDCVDWMADRERQTVEVSS